jgi:hypothetical protein
MSTVTHLAGPAITVGSRVIQRCCICGAKLCDSENCAMPLEPDGSIPEFPTWEKGRLIQVEEGNPTRYSVLPDMEKLPEDSCIDMV